MPEQLSFNYNGFTEFIPKDTVIKNAITIAGKDGKKVLRDTPRLVATYGGDPSEWKKQVGKIYSDKYAFDIHWYEYGGVIYEPKIKAMKERKKK